MAAGEAEDGVVDTAPIEVTTTTAPPTPLEQTEQLVGESVVSRSLVVDFTDGRGYTFGATLDFAVGNVRKIIENSDPGFAQLAMDMAVRSTITNTTSGRNTTVEDPGNVFLLFSNTNTDVGSCYSDDPTFPGGFCIAGMGASSGAGAAGLGSGIEAPPNLELFNESGRQELISSNRYREDDLDQLVSSINSGGGIIGFEVTFETSRTTGVRIVFNVAGQELERCEIGEFDSYAELCAL